jgi:hypothetical protein
MAEQGILWLWNYIAIHIVAKLANYRNKRTMSVNHARPFTFMKHIQIFGPDWVVITKRAPSYVRTGGYGFAL